MSQLKEGIDYYMNEDGMLVFMAAYHLKRGSCCSRGCKHCPYDYINVPSFRRAQLLAQRKEREERRDQ